MKVNPSPILITGNKLSYSWLLALVLSTSMYLAPGHVAGQSQDSILSFEAFIDIVRQHHPFVYRTELLLGMRDADVLKARGAFDPKISSSLDHKQFDDKNYFTLLQGGLSVPLIFGSDIKLSFDRNNGQFLNNSDIVPDQGLFGPGIDLVLGRGLISDNRRATLERSKLLRLAGEFEKQIILNELMFNAAQSYLYWQQSSLTEQLIVESVVLAQNRLAITKESMENGFMAPVDTLETSIELQSRQQNLLSILEKNTNNKTELGNYLWVDGTLPVQLEEGMQSDSLALDYILGIVDSLQLFEDELLTTHPLLASYDNKISVLEVDEKLNKENLKPDLRLSYSPLIDFDNQINNGSLFMDNYKAGAFFSYPIFTRKERAELQKTRLKIEDTGYTRRQKEQELRTLLRQYATSIAFTRQQLERITKIRTDSKALLDAELDKFRIGESSVFLVNSREQKYIAIRKKEIDLRLDLLQTGLKYIYKLNRLDLL